MCSSMWLIQATLQRRPVMKCDVLSSIWRSFVQDYHFRFFFKAKLTKRAKPLLDMHRCQMWKSLSCTVLNGTENRVNCDRRYLYFTDKSSWAFTCTGYSIYMQAVGTQAALGSAHITPEGNGYDLLQTISSALNSLSFLHFFWEQVI